MRFEMILLSIVMMGAGCSSTCIRNSDCPSAQSCQHGACKAVMPQDMGTDLGPAADLAERVDLTGHDLPAAQDMKVSADLMAHD